MNSALWPFLGLISLVIITHITSFVFHILDDRFYAFFHLAAGIMAAFFFYSLTKNYLLSVLLVELLGIDWEIFEYYEWKWILKKKKYRPQPDDTRNDLIVDFMGSIVGISILAFWPIL